LSADVTGQPIGPIFKGQAVQDSDINGCKWQPYFIPKYFDPAGLSTGSLLYYALISLPEIGNVFLIIRLSRLVFYALDRLSGAGRVQK
jgi:hypothetical protein